VRLIACGALARELLLLMEQCPPDSFELSCLPASWHNHPERILPGVKRKVEAARRDGKAVMVVYGDCGTGGALDAYLDAEAIDRIPGPHCYEMFLGKADFAAEMDTALGTFFLTDYMVRHFERLIMNGMGLRRHPQLRDLYFANYTRLLYIAQTDDAALRKKARAAADDLGLAYEYRFTGYGVLAEFLGQGHRMAGMSA
jgi:hypothetical protein